MEAIKLITLELGRLEFFNSKTSTFEYEDGGMVRFEYTLKVLYDWEGKWRKPFLKGELTERELLEFYMMMAIDPIDEKFMSSKVLKALAEYIKDDNTATKFTSHGTGGKPTSKAKIYTSEEIYALMIEAGIPLEFENRNLNRLLTILRVIGSHNEPPKKMNQQEIFRQNAELNRQRREKLKTKG